LITQHIIATDDDASIRKILNIILTRAGYAVTTCANSEELFDELSKRSNTVNIIILDINMPGLSGFEVLPILQKDYPEIPIIMLTAYSDLDTGMKAIRLGASDYLSKPVEKQDLLKCVERVLHKAHDKKLKAHAMSISAEYQKKLEDQLNRAQTTIMHTTMDTIEAFSETIEQKDVYTKGHCSRVRDLSLRLSEYLHLSLDDIAILEGGALLHDIGKIGIPESILNKKEALTNDEYTIIQMHPEAGERIVKHIDMFKPYLSIIRNHHERYDGKGYPDGLCGEEIPLLVRVVTISDAFDAMTSSRPYRSALPKVLAVEELKLCSGSQFDPKLVDLFIDNEIYNC